MNQSIITCIFFSIAGYLSGSILYAYWIPKILFQKDICALSPDGNPGTANAFVYGGFRAGILALLLELFKGFFPVVLALRTLDIDTPYMIPILIAPVFGHAFPLQFHPKNSNKKGGKAIAVSFGVLLGIFPVVLPVLFLAAAYILFSVVLIIRPHLFRSIITFGVLCLLVFLFVPVLSIDFACLGIALLVIYKHLCAYQNEKLSIRFFFQNSFFKRYLPGNNFGSLFGYQNLNLPLGTWKSVFCIHGPVIFIIYVDSFFSHIYHWLNRKHHARN